MGWATFSLMYMLLLRIKHSVLLTSSEHVTEIGIHVVLLTRAQELVNVVNENHFDVMLDLRNTHGTLSGVG